MSFSVAIADNHDVTRWGVRSVVEGCNGVVVAAAETGLETLAMVEEHKPRVLVLSLDLPHVSGFDVLRHLQRRALAVEVMVLTTHDEEARVRKAFELGVTAYVLKRDPVEELGEAVESAARGQHYLSPSLPQSLMDAFTTEGTPAETGYRALTNRQRDVLRLTAEGYTSAEVGEKLGLSPRTIEKHRRKIREILGLRNVVEMTRYAVHMGFYSTSQLDWMDQLGT